MNKTEVARLLALCNLAMSDAGNVAWWAKYHYRVWRPILGIRQTTADRSWTPVGAPRTNVRQVSPAAPATIFMAGTDRVITVQDVFLGGITRAVDGQCDTSNPLYTQSAFTPNFPAYPSGHATFGAAAFQMLKLVRAENKKNGDGNTLTGRIYSDELNGSSVDNFYANLRDFIGADPTTTDDLIAGNNDSRVLLGVHWRFDSNGGAEAGGKVAAKIYATAYKPA
jgi:hypothetical protein